jgi:hypothetical protein
MEDEFNAFIEAEGFDSIGEDLFRSPEGEIWHIDQVWDLMMELQANLL